MWLYGLSLSVVADIVSLVMHREVLVRVELFAVGQRPWLYLRERQDLPSERSGARALTAEDFITKFLFDLPDVLVAVLVPAAPTPASTA